MGEIHIGRRCEVDIKHLICKWSVRTILLHDEDPYLHELESAKAASSYHYASSRDPVAFISYTSFIETFQFRNCLRAGVSTKIYLNTHLRTEDLFLDN